MDLVKKSLSFTEIAAQLDKAITIINEKKDIFDKASAAVAQASKEYSESVENAQFLREELNKSLNDTMGNAQQGRVRVSG